MTQKSYSLRQVADAYLPAEWTDSIRWLQRRLRRKEIPGYKVGHVWRMTQADVDAMIARYHNTPTSPADPESDSPRPLSFTRRSTRQLRAS